MRGFGGLGVLGAVVGLEVGFWRVGGGNGVGMRVMGGFGGVLGFGGF